MYCILGHVYLYISDKGHPPDTFEEDGVLSGFANDSRGLKEVFWICNNQGVLQKQE